MSLAELEQDPFDVDEFVERLTWRKCGSMVKADAESFNPGVLHDAFEEMIRDLKKMKTQVEKEEEKLRVQCKEEEQAHWRSVTELQKKNQGAFGLFQSLDERINYVATKVVHLGDQLEGVNIPRTRADEAAQLMGYFRLFMETDSPQSDLFSDPFRLEEQAYIIQKLNLIAQELPSVSQFQRAKVGIEVKYKTVQEALLLDFQDAMARGDLQRMKVMVDILTPFKEFGKCISIFVDSSLKKVPEGQIMFDSIPAVCDEVNATANTVFFKPATVMSAFVSCLFTGRVKKYIDRQLEAARSTNKEEYLNALQTLYSRTLKLCTQLQSLQLGGDPHLLTRTTREIFKEHLDKYISEEAEFLQRRCEQILQRYYDSKQHQKKAVSNSGMREIQRELQAVLATNFNLPSVVVSYGGDTFLSQEISISLLQETKQAYKRCQLLSSRHDMAGNASRIFDLLIKYLCIEHVNYAMEIGLLGIPLGEPRVEPETHFLTAMCQANSVFHLFEKQFTDSLLPLITSSSKHSECLLKKKEIMELLEYKMDLGLDRLLTAIVGWVRHILVTEQKKTDFKPESDGVGIMEFSQACGSVTRYVGSQLALMRANLDGRNCEVLLTEFGIRFHRVIVEHLMMFQYNQLGGTLAISDANEYRKCIKEFGVPMLVNLFDTLHALCNLLYVVPDNLKQVSTGDSLAQLDRATILQFVQLRADFKTNKLVSQLK